MRLCSARIPSPHAALTCVCLARTETRRVWEEYQLAPRTRFNTRVTAVKRVGGIGKRIYDPSPQDARSKWMINDGADGEFDAVVVTVGTCGAPARVDIPGLPRADSEEDEDEEREGDGGEKGPPREEKHKHKHKHRGGKGGEVYEGEVLHSSELDGADLEGRTVLVVGSGASGVEAVETALANGARHCVMIAREDKVCVPPSTMV